MKCAVKCMKYTVFFFNFLVFLSGAALLGLGIWAAVSGDSFKAFSSSNSFAAIYIILAVGAALFLVGFLGCCGAINENRCLLGAFFAIVLIIFLVQIVGAVLIVVFKDDAEDKISRSMADYHSSKEVSDAWDVFQDLFKCCGMRGPEDWGTVVAEMPNSCCDEDECNQANAYDQGCKEKFSTLFWIIAGVAFGILLIEFLAMLFACCLYHNVGSGAY